MLFVIKTYIRCDTGKLYVGSVLMWYNWFNEDGGEYERIKGSRWYQHYDSNTGQDDYKVG